MKPEIHPDYRPVVFQDLSEGATFVIRSTVETSDTITLDDGVEYPLVKVEISSARISWNSVSSAENPRMLIYPLVCQTQTEIHNQ